MEMVKETLHEVKAPAETEAETEAVSSSRWKTISDLPFEAQEAIHQVRGTGAGAKKAGETLGIAGDTAKKGDGPEGSVGPDEPQELVEGIVTAYTASRGTGSATVVTGISSTGELYDEHSPTSVYLALLKKKPDADPVVLWGRAIMVDPNNGGEMSHTFNPKAPADAAVRSRYALVIANGEYTPKIWDDLKRSRPDGAAIAGHHKGLDGGAWKVNHLENLTADQSTPLVEAYRDRPQRGDGVFISVHGHGSREGFVGIHGKITPWGLFGAIANRAVDEGWKCTIVADTCHGGRLQHFMGQGPGDAVAGTHTSTMEMDGSAHAADLLRSTENDNDAMAEHERKARLRVPTSDTPKEAVGQLIEHLEFGNDPRVMSQLGSVADAFAHEAEYKGMRAFKSENEALKAVCREFVRLKGHTRLQDPEMKDAFKDAQIQLYLLRKVLEKAGH